MRVGYLQFDPVFGEVAHNLDLITARLEEAEADRAARHLDGHRRDKDQGDG